jgi:hypothetical protein
MALQSEEWNGISWAISHLLYFVLPEELLLGYIVPFELF